MALEAQAISEPKWEFLKGVFLSNSMRDSITTRRGRRVYTAEPTDKQRSDLGKVLRSELRRIAAGYFFGVVREEEHVQNISELAGRVSEACKPLLNGGCICFGIAQKALNSYLKYLWCANLIPTPPHCPFDDIIIRKLELSPTCERQWTKADESAYRAWVSAAKLAAMGKSLAEWELYEWATSADSPF
jgi:hypothetical protein